MFKNVIASLAILALLSGCAFNNPPEVVYKNVYKVASLPESHFQTEPTPAPPSKEEFMNQTDRERVVTLSIYSQKLLTHAANLKEQITGSIKKALEEQKTSLEKGNPQ